MSKSVWSGAISALMVLAAAAAPVYAQDKADVDLQYQIQHAYDNTMALGVNADVAGRILPSLSAVGQIDWSHKSESITVLGITNEGTLNVTTFGGGIRWTGGARPNLEPFAQFLVGASHFSGEAVTGSISLVKGSSTDGMIQFGGGVAFPLNAKIAGVAQVDYRRIFTEGEGTNSVRFAFGVRWMKKS